MPRNLYAFLCATIVTTFSPLAAEADWLMVGPYEFKPTDPKNQGTVLADGFKLTNNVKANAVASLNLPMGHTINSLYCQLYDAHPSITVVASLKEYATDDLWQSPNDGRTIFNINSEGSVGHKVYTDFTATGSNVVRPFENLVGSYRYFSYILVVTLDGTPATAIKSCAIEHWPS